MQVYQLCTLDELMPYADQWDRLTAGMPLRSWAWLASWWQHYGDAGQLSVLCVFDDADLLVGVAPWYVARSTAQGRVIRWLGSGEVCSDYSSLLCQPSAEYRVVRAVADWLLRANAGEPPGDAAWDLLELTGVDAEDPLVGQLAARLAERGCPVHRHVGPNCWRVALSADWDHYLAMLSKSHRKQLRRLEREWFDTGRAVLHTVQRYEELGRAADILIGLHQQRHRTLGQPGCFASPRFAAFQQQAMMGLLAQGHLQLHWLEVDGQPIAAEYHMAGAGIVYAYQSGIDPRRLDVEPGRLITLATLRRAVEQGCRAMDFLRGDEPYKAHFRAEPRPLVAYRVVANRPWARWRYNLWSAGYNVKQWLRNPHATTADCRETASEPQET